MNKQKKETALHIENEIKKLRNKNTEEKTVENTQWPFTMCLLLLYFFVSAILCSVRLFYSCCHTLFLSLSFSLCVSHSFSLSFSKAIYVKFLVWREYCLNTLYILWSATIKFNHDTSKQKPLFIEHGKLVLFYVSFYFKWTFYKHIIRLK